MKKIMKKIMSILIVLALISAIPVSVFATSSSDFTITISSAEFNGSTNKLSVVVNLTGPAEAAGKTIGFSAQMGTDWGDWVPCSEFGVFSSSSTNVTNENGKLLYTFDSSYNAGSEVSFNAEWSMKDQWDSWDTFVQDQVIDAGAGDSIEKFVLISYRVTVGSENKWIIADWDGTLIEHRGEIASGPINMVSGNTGTYSASLKTSATDIEAGGTFTTDVYMTSDSDLSAGQVTLSATGGTITNIALAEGLVKGEKSGNNFISFYNNSASASKGLKIATVTVEANQGAESVSLNISAAKAAKSGDLADQNVTLGSDSSVSVAIKTANQFAVSDYSNGMYLIQYTGSVADGSIAKYGDKEMFWSEKYGAWAYLSDTNVKEKLTNASFSADTGTKQQISYQGDVNGNGEVNIVDAQAAYDIATGVYSSLSSPTVQQWLMADANGDSLATAEDARRIQCIIHGIS